MVFVNMTSPHYLFAKAGAGAEVAAVAGDGGLGKAVAQQTHFPTHISFVPVLA
jgi:hypothetical protein